MPLLVDQLKKEKRRFTWLFILFFLVFFLSFSLFALANFPFSQSLESAKDNRETKIIKKVEIFPSQIQGNWENLEGDSSFLIFSNFKESPEKNFEELKQYQIEKIQIKFSLAEKEKENSSSLNNLDTPQENNSFQENKDFPQRESPKEEELLTPEDSSSLEKEEQTLDNRDNPETSFFKNQFLSFLKKFFLQSKKTVQSFFKSKIVKAEEEREKEDLNLREIEDSKIEEPKVEPELKEEIQEISPSQTDREEDKENRIIISYLLKNDSEKEQSQTASNSENWQVLRVLTNPQNGVFTLETPFLVNWTDLENLKIKFENQSEKNQIIYLEKVWLEVDYSVQGEIAFELVSLKKDWQAGEEPEFEIKETSTEKNIFSFLFNFLKPEKKPEIEQLSLEKSEGEEEVTERDISLSLDNSSEKIKLEKDLFLEPGEYTLAVKINWQGEDYVLEKSFGWGVLAINLNKSIYLPGETAFIQMAALDKFGNTLCNANLRLEIITPNSQKEILTSEEKSINFGESCGPNNVTDNPDYFAYYQVKEPGSYKIKLTNLDNGYEIEDSFEVREKVPFEIERRGATRINPFLASYLMTIKIKAKDDFQGEITETIPSSFEVKSQSSNFNFQIIPKDQKSQKLIWKGELEKGKEYEIKYQYQAPKISPAIFLLGPLEFSSFNFSENRHWQLASDAACQSNGGGGGDWSDPNSWNFCGGGTPQATDTVTILTGDTITFDTSATILNLTIQSGGTLTNNGTAQTLTLSGTSGVLFTKQGTFSPGNFISVIMNPDADVTPTSGTITFYNLTLSPTITASRNWTLGSGDSWAQLGNSLSVPNTGVPALAALNSTDVAFIDSNNQQLRTYRFDGTNWAQVGNSLSVPNTGNPALAALNSTDVAFIDYSNRQLRTYRFDGTNWAQVGNSLSVPNTSFPALAALNSTDVAFIDFSNRQLRTYRFDGTNWAQVGNSLSVPNTGFPALAALNSTDVAFIDSSNRQLRTYRFDGTNWAQVGNSLSVPNTGSPALAALNSTDVAFIDSFNRQLRTYRFDGTNWAQISSSLSVPITSFPALAALNSTDVAFIDSSNDQLRTYRFTNLGLGTGDLTINGDFTINPTASSAFALTVNMGANITVAPTGTTTITRTGSATSALVLRPSAINYNLTTGRLNIATGGTLDGKSGSSIITLNGTSGTLWTQNGTFIQSLTTVIFNPDANVTLTSGNITFWDLTLSPTITANRVYTFGSSPLTISRNFTINPNAASALELTVNLGANTSIATSCFGCGITITRTGSALSTLNTTASNFSITTRNLTISDGGTLTANGSTITLTTNASSPVFTNNGTFNAGTSTVVMNPGASVTLTSGTITFNNLTLSPTITANTTYTFGSGALTINGDFTINPNAFSALTLTVNMGDDITVAANKKILIQRTGSAVAKLRSAFKVAAQLGNSLSVPNTGFPALAALNSTDVAFIDAGNRQLRTYRFDGTNWAQVSSSLSVPNTGFPALAALNSTDVAFIDSLNQQLRTYRFDGTNWAQVGNSLSVPNTGFPALAALNSTDVAFIDLSNKQLRTYRFDGTNWAQVGNSLSVPNTGFPALAALNSTDVAFIDSSNQQLRTYRFDGTNWAQVGNSLLVPTGFPALAALNSTDVAFIDGNNQQLRTYRFDGTNWAQVGNSLNVTNTGFPALAALNSTDVAFIDSSNRQLRTYRFPPTNLSAGRLEIQTNSEFDAFNSTVTLNSVTGTLLTNNGTFTAGTSTVVMNPDASVTLTSGTITFNNLTLSPTLTASRTYTFGSGALTINGDFTINPNASSALSLTVNMGASITVANTKTTTITRTGSATSELNTTASNYSLSTGRLNIESGGTLTANNSTITLTGTSGTLFTRNGTFNAGTSTVVMNPDASVILTSGTITFNNLTLSPTLTANRTYTFGSGALTINGNFTINPNASSALSLTVNMGASITVANTKTTTITRTGSATSELNTTASNYSLSTGRLNIESGGTLTANSSTITLTGTSGTLFTRNGTFNAGSSTVNVEAGGSTTLNSTPLTFYNLNINSAGNTITLGQAITVNNDLTVTAGTFSGSENITVNGNVSGAGTITLSGGIFEQRVGADKNFGSSSGANEWRFAILIFSNSSGADRTITLNNGTGNIRVDNLLQIGRDTDSNQTIFDNTTNSRLLDINGNLDITSRGTLLASNNQNINLAGNWTNSGIFTSNNGTVVLDGADQTISGDNTFYNLNKTTNTAATLTFEADKTQTITNTLTLKGAQNNLLSLRSSLDGTQWKIDPQGTREIEFVDVKDSNNINSSIIDCVNKNCTDSGNNTNWLFVQPPSSGGETFVGSRGGSQVARIKEEEIPNFLRWLLELEKKLFPKKEEIEEKEKVPPPFKKQWQLLPLERLKRFVLEPLPPQINKLVEQFPDLKETFKELGIKKSTDLKRLTSARFILPGLSKITQAGPVNSLPQELKAKIPPDFIFVRVGTELIDINLVLSFNEKGEMIQKINVLSNKTFQLIIRPEKPIKSAKGYLVFRSRKTTLNPFKPFSLLFESLFAFAKNSNSEEVEKLLLLKEFEYTDPDGDGIYTAEFQTPSGEGEYEIITLLDYQDSSLGQKEIRLITVVDPEGYVFEKVGGKETRVKEAVVSLYWFNEEKGNFELWPAEKYQQENPQTTDLTGKYSFLVPEGRYYLAVKAPGYLDYQGKPFEVRRGTGIHQNIELKKKFSFAQVLSWQNLLLIILALLLLYNFYRDRILRKKLNV